MKRILETNETLRRNVEIMDSNLPSNLHSILKTKVHAARQLAVVDPETDGVNDEATGINLLGNMLYRINPSQAKVKNFSEGAPDSFRMDPFIGMSLFADMTKSRVVLHHLQPHFDAEESAKPVHDRKAETANTKFQVRHVFDGRHDEFKFNQLQTPGLLDDEDEKTINVV